MNVGFTSWIGRASSSDDSLAIHSWRAPLSRQAATGYGGRRTDEGGTLGSTRMGNSDDGAREAIFRILFPIRFHSIPYWIPYSTVPKHYSVSALIKETG